MKKILVVDDEPLICSSLSKALKSINTEVRAVATGEDAIVEISSCFYDLCFLDIRLPGINGIDVMRNIHKISPQTKVFIMTACHVDENMKKEIEDGADYFINKPFELSQIKAITKQAL